MRRNSMKLVVLLALMGICFCSDSDAMMGVRKRERVSKLSDAGEFISRAEKIFNENQNFTCTANKNEFEKSSDNIKRRYRQSVYYADIAKVYVESTISSQSTSAQDRTIAQGYLSRINLFQQKIDDIKGQF